MRRGRKEEFARFGWSDEIPDPQAESTFLASKLNWDLQKETRHRALWDFYRELLRLRRELSPLARLDKESLEVTTFAHEKVVLAKRWDASGQVLVICHFDGASTEFALPVPSGRWRKLLDSTQRPHDEDGSPVIELHAMRGEMRLLLHPWAFLVLAQQAEWFNGARLDRNRAEDFARVRRKF